MPTVQRIGTGRLGQINNGPPQARPEQPARQAPSITVNVTADDPRKPERQAKLIATRMRDAISSRGLTNMVIRRGLEI